MRLLDWTEGLPAGLSTEVGERGARMSGGQRQRLAIARALLADFPLLVLDEPGEHLDTPTADAIVADLLAITRERATLLITHRLAGLQEVDEVLVLDQRPGASSAAPTPSCSPAADATRRCGSGRAASRRQAPLRSSTSRERSSSPGLTPARMGDEPGGGLLHRDRPLVAGACPRTRSAT